MTKPNRPVRALAVVVLAGALALLAVTPAWAHNSLVSASPAENATLSTPPAKIELTYDQPVGRQFSQVVVTGPDGQPWQQGQPQVSSDTVTQALKPLELAGTYTVAWRVVSADGHPISGTYEFVMKTGSTGEGADQGADRDAGEGVGQEANRDERNDEGAQGTRSDQGDGSAEGVAPWVWIAAGVGALAVVAVAVGGVRRGRRDRGQV